MSKPILSGANSFRLARHSLADRVREINLAGAHVAREAAKSFDVWVAGSIGPLGVRIEPLGKTSFEEARTAFREQVAALIEGGVDLLMLETFGYLEELHQAVLACRDVNAKIPIVAQVTIDEDGNCLDGSTPETFAARLAEWGADVIGMQLQRGSGRDARCDGAGARGHYPAPGRPAERRNAALGRRQEHLSLLAGIHGELRPKVCGGRSAAGRRMLRNHAGTYPRHEVGAAGGRSPRQDRVTARFIRARLRLRRSGEHSPGGALAAGRKDCLLAVCHHGRNRARPRERTSARRSRAHAF